jgi:hypothetical protein
MTAAKLQILPIPSVGNVTAYCADSKILQVAGLLTAATLAV